MANGLLAGWGSLPLSGQVRVRRGSRGRVGTPHRSPPHPEPLPALGGQRPPEVPPWLPSRGGSTPIGPGTRTASVGVDPEARDSKSRSWATYSQSRLNSATEFDSARKPGANQHPYERRIPIRYGAHMITDLARKSSSRAGRRQQTTGEAKTHVEPTTDPANRILRAGQSRRTPWWCSLP